MSKINMLIISMGIAYAFMGSLPPQPPIRTIPANINPMKVLPASPRKIAAGFCILNYREKPKVATS
tara:strand:+ start:1023 stop:1220 length:198 start_codon:yes stop_codon:yes gene_type:complete